VLDEHAVFKNPDLDAAETTADDHDSVDALPAGQKFGLGDDRTTTTGIPTIATSLLLGLETGGPLDALRLRDGGGCGARLANLDHDVWLVVSIAGLLAGTTT
jgi:hypothetical protein